MVDPGRARARAVSVARAEHGPGHVKSRLLGHWGASIDTPLGLAIANQVDRWWQWPAGDR